MSATETAKERLARLERELEETRLQVEVEEAAAFTAKITEIAEALNASGIDIRDLVAFVEAGKPPKVWPSKQKGTTAPAPKKPKADLPPKYRDPATGKTWTGRGRSPEWVRGHEAEFAIV